MATTSPVDSMQHWLGVSFQSSSNKTPQFRRFANQFRYALAQLLGPQFDLVDMQSAHFYISGFARRRSTGKFVYISISDVRFFQDSWYKTVLIRTAEHARDFTGGRNHSVKLPDIQALAMELTEAV